MVSKETETCILARDFRLSVDIFFHVPSNPPWFWSQSEDFVKKTKRGGEEAP